MAKNPTPSQLDPGQILKRVYDEANDQLRTTISASVNVDGQQTLVINHVEDSIVAFGTETGAFSGAHRAIKVATDGTVQTAVTSSALPAGAASEAKQDVGNASLASIDAKATTLINQTDGVEASLTSIDGKVSTAANQVIEIARLDTLILQTDTVEAQLTTIDADIRAVQGASGTLAPTKANLTAGINPATGFIQNQKTDANGSQFTVLTSPNHPNQFSDISPYNRLRVTTEPTTLLVDKFDGSVLDPNTWTTRLQGTGTITLGTGNLSVNTGVTLSNYAILTSVPFFQHPGNAFLQFGMAVKYESALTTNTHRIWGFATLPTTPSFATPLQDGVVFEVDSVGALRASIYATGVRVFTQVITATANGLFNRYDIIYNTQNISWFLNSILQAQITTGVNPAVQNLPATLAMYNSTTTAPAATPVLQSQAFAITDTACNNKTISDGRYPWRKAIVLPNNLLATSHPDEALAFMGRSWRVTSDQVTLANNVETPIFYVTNPTNSGKIFKLLQTYCGTPAANNTFNLYRYYLNPTITANGTAITPVAGRQNNQATLGASFFRSPTTSANGSLFDLHRVQAGSSDLLIDSKAGIWIEPGHRLLITMQNSSALGGIGHFSCFFYEDPTFGG